MQKRALNIVTLFILFAVFPNAAIAQRAFNFALPAVPSQGEPTIDGQLNDWDRSGEIVMSDGTGGPVGPHSVRVYAMFNGKSLFLAFDVKDSTPLINHVDPDKTPDKGWGGDCVQVRLKTSGDASTDLIYIDSWYYSDGKRPAMEITYPSLAQGRNYRDQTDALDHGAAAAFTTNKKSTGYIQEMRIPWNLLLSKGQSRKSGAVYRMAVEVVWNGKKSFIESHRVVDVVAHGDVNTKGFYEKIHLWGRLVLAEHGNLDTKGRDAIVTAEVPGARRGGVRKIKYPCTVDNSLQPALFFAPASREPLPLLVALHSWSTAYTSVNPYVQLCRKYNWNMIGPNFRGPNKTPMACGSDAAVQDVLDAVAYAKKNANVDSKRIYLMGGSGGGHMALQMAGRSPKTWTAVSSWVPISDLTAWHRECTAKGRHYAGMIEKCCGGPPGSSRKVDEEYRKRSPLTHLPRAKGKVLLDINTGIHDGHTGSVPVSHALHAFNAVADKRDRITDEDIQYMVRKRAIPEHLRMKKDDPSIEGDNVLFRRTSGKARITVVKGGHCVLRDQAFRWLARQGPRRRVSGSRPRSP